jgi:hypothetical protein
MKTKVITLGCVLAITLTTVTPSMAADDSDSMKVIADTIIVRPACLVATVIGSAVFVIGLPFSAFSKSIKQTAYTLIVRPARATFTRQMGDMDSLEDY